MKNYKLIIYDLDGTLIDSRSDIAATVNATLTFMGKDVLPRDVVVSYVGRGVRELLLKTLGTDDAKIINEATIYFRDYYYKHCVEESTLYPHAREMIIKFHEQGIKQAAFTNKPQVFTDRSLQLLGVYELFDCVLGAENGFPLKPAPEGVFYIMEQVGVEKTETLFVGDTIVDYETAQNAGVDFVMMGHGYADALTQDELREKGVQVLVGFEEIFDRRKA